MSDVFRIVSMVSIALAPLLGSEARADFNQLVQHVPETANALVLVDAKRVFDSPISKQEDWTANRAKQFAAGLTSIPPKASKLVIASYVDVEAMHPAWEVAVVQMESDRSMSDFAKQFGGALDTVASVPAVRLPDDSIVLQFAPGVLGGMSPGNRQQVSRWVDRSNRSLSPYLREGVGYAESAAQVLMILDLHDAFSVDDVTQVLKRFESLQGPQVDTAEVAKVVASVRGVMLGITFQEQAYGKLKIDFGEDASSLSEFAKPLILEMLGDYGVMIDEFSGWKAEVKGNRMFLGGELTYNGLTRLTSLIELPTTALNTPAVVSQDQPVPENTATGNTAAAGQPQTMLETTKQYFESVQHLLRNLQLKKHDMKTMGQLAMWFENYGRKLDRSPTLNVDKEMLQYGSYISSQLHGASMSLKGVTIQRRVNEVAATNSSSIYGGALGNISQNNWQSGGRGYGGGFGGNYGRRRETNAAFGVARHLGAMGAFKSGLRQQQQAQTAVRVDAKAQAATSVQQIVQNIETATNQIRQAMTDKYQVQF